MDEVLLKNMKELKKIYSSIIDEESKKIFINRLLFSITGDVKYIHEMLDVDEITKIIKKYEQENKKLVIFGAGDIGKEMTGTFFKDVKWECFVDNNLKVKEVNRLKVIGFDELKLKYFDAIIVISPFSQNGEIYDQLINEGFCKTNIINFGEYLMNYGKIMKNKQYFEFPPEGNKKESFVDAGCFNGENTKEFIEWCGGNYSNIWAFEPDSINYEFCKKELKIPKCKLYNMGIFDTTGTVSFKSGLQWSSTISTDGEVEIKTIKLDELLKNEKVTFIKMDIEGVELNALKGAENIIREQKPRLAICVYHKIGDIVSIPSLILKYNPNYKFKLRHYSSGESETVLYAF